MYNSLRVGKNALFFMKECCHQRLSLCGLFFTSGTHLLHTNWKTKRILLVKNIVVFNSLLFTSIYNNCISNICNILY